MTARIRVLVVDDQTLLRRGLRGLLEMIPDLEVVGEAADGNEALERIATLRPDVILLDVRMPGLGGVEVLERLGGDRPAAILLTTFDDDAALLAGIRAGARGFLLKDVALEDLTTAIRAVAAGATLLRPAITARVERFLERGVSFERHERPDPLTPRELEVLRLIAAGMANREIAAAFGTSEGTVKNHASAILSKLGVRDRTRAVLRAIDLGWL